MLYRPFCGSPTVFRLNKLVSAKPPLTLISGGLNFGGLDRKGDNCGDVSTSLVRGNPYPVNRIDSRGFQRSCFKMAESNGTEHDRSKCIFCKVVDGKERNEIFYQDEEIVVFADIKPAAKYHLLVVTREHIKDSKSLVSSQIDLLDRLTQIGLKVLTEKITKDTPDTDPEQVQKLMGFHWPPFHTVSHLHLHIIAPSDQMGFIARTIFKPNSFWFVTSDYVRERLEKMAATEASNSNPQ